MFIQFSQFCSRAPIERKALEDALKDDLEDDDEDDSAEALLDLQDDDGNILLADSVGRILIIN